MMGVTDRMDIRYAALERAGRTTAGNRVDEVVQSFVMS